MYFQFLQTNWKNFKPSHLSLLQRRYHHPFPLPHLRHLLTPLQPPQLSLRPLDLPLLLYNPTNGDPHMSNAANVSNSTDTPPRRHLLDTATIHILTQYVQTRCAFQFFIVVNTNPSSQALKSLPQLYFYFFNWHHYYILSIATRLYPRDGHRALSLY